MKTIKNISRNDILKLKAGEQFLISGSIYTARDQAHKRLFEAIKNRKKLPVELKDKIIYYCGPTKRPINKVIGSCGPTTSSRMDEFTPLLLEHGVMAMIGKGKRSKEVVEAIKKHKAVYLLAYAGCGALLSKYVVRAKPVAYLDLGPEAIYELEVKDFPVFVGADTKGGYVYAEK